MEMCPKGVMERSAGYNDAEFLVDLVGGGVGWVSMHVFDCAEGLPLQAPWPGLRPR